MEKTTIKLANLTKNQQLAIRWGLTRLDGLSRGSRTHRVREVEWLVARVGKHPVPSLRWAAWLFWEWDLLDLPHIWETQILSVFVINVYFLFIQATEERTDFEVEAQHRPGVPPLSSIPPSFTLPPPLVSEAAIMFCSNEGTSTAAGMEERGHWEEKKTHFSTVIEPGV